ncbi:unnamed protein product [Linum trigynum]|uniref:Reverse transcriptase domain-containing protein n=1 Tax=Linum trigynum TaxID=586398 RepID=A0AAV2CQR0_9ROSI
MNTIRRLNDAAGRVYTGQQEVTSCLVESMKGLFAKGNRVEESRILPLVTPRVTSDMKQILLAPFTEEEIWFALKCMGSNKAPGPDGMSARFFQKHCHIVGQTVLSELRGYLEVGEFPMMLNKTLIALIPKKNKPSTPTDFRPISLCNVLYKIMSKVLANRLKQLLNMVIGEQQSAFIPGRFITDNILIAFECFHTIKQKTRAKTGFMAAKLDISKAYDRVEWDFLEAMMLKFGFAERWVRMIMKCITTVTYSILVNGHRSEEFQPEMGLRQGNPLSPYLFLFCVEGLATLLTNVVNSGKIHGLKTSARGPIISHLLFADDSVLFTKILHRKAAN